MTGMSILDKVFLKVVGRSYLPGCLLIWAIFFSFALHSSVIPDYMDVLLLLLFFLYLCFAKPYP